TTSPDLTRAAVDRIVRDTVREIGYVDPTIGFAADTCQVDCHLHKQSGDISMGVDTGGAGDQGMMFGFACDETHTLMPLPIYLAHRLGREPPPLRPRPGVAVGPAPAPKHGHREYNADGTPHRIHTVVLSTQHDESVVTERGKKKLFSDDARKVLVDKLILPTLKAERPDLLKGPIQLVQPGASPEGLREDAIACH